MRRWTSSMLGGFRPSRFWRTCRTEPRYRSYGVLPFTGCSRGLVRSTGYVRAGGDLPGVFGRAEAFGRLALASAGAPKPSAAIAGSRVKIAIARWRMNWDGGGQPRASLVSRPSAGIGPRAYQWH